MSVRAFACSGYAAESLLDAVHLRASLQVRAVAVAPDKLHRGVTDRTAGVEALPQVSDPVKERPLLDGVEIGPVLRAALSTVGS